jgi:DNA-binding PadR family transcriptional regulator
VKSTWRTTENNRRARYYELTAAGLRQLDAERTAWVRASGAIESVMSPSWTLASAGL